MKKISILLLASGFWLLASTSILAHEEDPATPAAQTVKSKVDEIKEKIASTVASLNLVSKKALIGEISRLEKTQITIETRGETRIIDVDELTKYINVNKDDKSQDIRGSDLGLANTIVAIGIYNKDSRKLLARIIMQKRVPININGVVKEVDVQDGTIKIEDKKHSKIWIVDIEKTTVIRIYSQSEDLVKTGLSKIEIGQRVHINGTANEKEKDRLYASRILLLPGKAVGITTPKPATSSASIATPTVTIKPTASPKPTKKPIPTATPTTETP